VPKGAVLSHGNLLASVAALAIAWHWTGDDRLVLCLPLFHMHGLGVGLHGTLFTGASAVLLDGFDPETVIDAAGEHEATLFFGVPTMYHRLVGCARVGELARLRLCVAGSAPLPPSVHDAFRAATGRTVLERYGMTETVMLVSNPYDGERRAGAVGFPLPGVEVRFVRDGGTSVDLPTAGIDGEAGEILVRGPNVFRGYWERPASNVAAFTDGWFRTGDLATVAPDCYITIVGRAKELIISGGFNVYPREVEEVLATHPAVADVAVVGTPSDEWGEEVTAFIVVRSGQVEPDRDVLREFCRDQLARYKLPRRVVIVDTLPRNALGKVVKHDLRCPP
jgi:malonyl-CoA/methylmalonyl-CoA synthetase